MILNDNAPRRVLLELYRAALERVSGRQVVRQWLTDAPCRRPVRLVAIGKAAEAMLEGALEVLDGQVAAALAITKHGYSRSDACRDERIECLEAGHPLPDATSLAAGQRLVKFITSAPADQSFVFLISGGTSSLVEVPIAGVGLEDLIALNQWLLGSGLDIGAMNRVRKAVSAIKGGRLTAWLSGRQVRCALISDVPDNDPASIGSGLLIARDETDLSGLVLPAWLQQKLAASAPPVRTRGSDAISCAILARVEDAMEGVADAARRRGLAVHVHRDLLQGPAADAGQRLASDLQRAAAGVHVWGGETSVRLPPHPGRGGRNQHLALAAAMELGGRSDCVLLAAGTDGSDGPTDAAGALVDGDTLARGEAEGLSARTALQQADSGRFLEASGDLIETGPTGTNVMDLVIAWKGPPESGDV